MSACAGKAEGRSRRMLAALKWRARHLLPPARAPDPQPTPAPPHGAETCCLCPCRHPGRTRVWLSSPGPAASSGCSQECCSGQEPCRGHLQPGRPQRLGRGTWLFWCLPQFLVISVFAQPGLAAGAAQQSPSLLRVPDRVSEHLLKCFPQYREHLNSRSSGLANSCSSLLLLFLLLLIQVNNYLLQNVYIEYNYF